MLNFLEEVAGNFEDMLTAYLNAGYGASSGRLFYLQRRSREARLMKKLSREEEIRKRNQCLKTISYLKAQNFIVEEGDIFKITSRGRKKEKLLREKLLKSLPIIDYPKIKTNQLILITFDIPEKMRNKRRWLRDVLRYFNFKMVHKSVWIGSVKIPKEFIEDLARIDLTGYIEIIGISQSGTLQRLSMTSP